MNRFILAALLTVGIAATARSMTAPGAVPPSGIVVSTVEHRGHSYTVVELDTRTHAIQLFTRPGGVTLAELQAQLGAAPLAAMNAGMYAEEVAYTPVGLSVSSGKDTHPLNTASGQGNFFLKPNGVFYMDDSGPHVVTSEEYVRTHPANVHVATQSGPMLLFPDATRTPRLHQAFTRNSQNLHTRNAVGVRGSTVVWVLSRDEVNLHHLATLFRQALHCESALYLDGTVSALSTPQRQDGATRRRWGGLLYVAP
jgi:uncharacterized protein YigE (DUF2233 family)